MCNVDTFHTCISYVMPLKGFNNVVAFIIKHQKYQILGDVRGNLCSVVQPKWLTVKSLNQGLGSQSMASFGSLIKGSSPPVGQRWWSCMVVVVVVGGFTNNTECQHRIQLVHLCPGKPTSPSLSYYGHSLSMSTTKTPDSEKHIDSVIPQHSKLKWCTLYQWNKTEANFRAAVWWRHSLQVNCRKNKIRTIHEFNPVICYLLWRPIRLASKCNFFWVCFHCAKPSDNNPKTPFTATPCIFWK